MPGRDRVFDGARMGDVQGAQGRFSRVRETVKPSVGGPASSRAALRGQGVERLDQVKLAVMESGGEISVVRKEPA